MTVYPEHPFRIWKFPRKISAHFWKNNDNKRLFLDQMAKELNFTSWEDWYKVIIRDIQDDAFHIR